jgi:hypothetical protein
MGAVEMWIGSGTFFLCIGGSGLGRVLGAVDFGMVPVEIGVATVIGPGVCDELAPGHHHG